MGDDFFIEKWDVPTKKYQKIFGSIEPKGGMDNTQMEIYNPESVKDLIMRDKPKPRKKRAIEAVSPGSPVKSENKKMFNLRREIKSLDSMMEMLMRM